MASRVLVERLCACEGVVPPMPNSARLSGDLGPSLPHRSASSLPTLGVMPLGTAGAALLAATCPVTLGELGNGSFPGFVGALAPIPLTLCLLPLPRDAICGQLQCQGGMAQPLLGSARDLYWETLEANGTWLNCSWVHLDLGNDVAQPLLTLPGTACGPGLVSNPGEQDQVGRGIRT